MAFFVVGSGGGAVTVPALRSGVQASDDGAGKRAWRVATAPMESADVDALKALIGTPGFAEAERAWDGTLLTDLPLVAVRSRRSKLKNGSS